MHVPWWAWAAAHALNVRFEDLNLSFTLSLHCQGKKGKTTPLLKSILDALLGMIACNSSPGLQNYVLTKMPVYFSRRQSSAKCFLSMLAPPAEPILFLSPLRLLPSSPF